METTVWISLIGAVVTVITVIGVPIVRGWLDQEKQDRQWERDDQVARDLKNAASLVAAEASRVASVLRETNAVTSVKLDEIHTQGAAVIEKIEDMQRGISSRANGN